ncbi:MAG TPA: GNAT family N-acetyltransferase [Pyrinomonadaceae bacterium]|nr:GNAT family N-acetyltransferase [Pyrinomonadaceae bacterium]
MRIIYVRDKDKNGRAHFASQPFYRETIFMEIKHVEKGGRGAFLIKEDGKRLAEMTYVTAGETGFIIDHTDVDESLRGQKVGDKLLAEAVKYAREKSLKIYATCPFALHVFKKTQDYADVFAG